MRWKWELDAQTMPDPIGYDESEFKLKFDRELRVYTAEFSLDVTFTGSAFDYILRTDEAGICSKILVNIYLDCDGSGSWTEWFEGYIFIVDCEFDLINGQVTCPVQDNSWTTLIKNNRNIKAYLNVGRSKNDNTITACTDRNIDFYTPSTGLYGTNNVETYLVFDAFKFLVAFMTDGAMTFESSLFDAGGDLEGLVICTGEAISNPSTNGYCPFISFEDLFSNMHKLFNLAMYVDLSGASPKLVIEKTDDIRTIAAPPVSFDYLDNLKRSYKPELLYTKVRVGSETTQDDAGGSFSFPDVRYVSHKEEEYHYSGECNVASELDLVKEWVIDSNIIEDIIVNAVTDYDGDIFIVQTDYPATDDATQFDFLDPGGSPPSPALYNYGLTNQQSIENYWRPNGMPTDLMVLLGDGDDGFEAKLSADITTSSGALTRDPGSGTPLEFATEISDPNGNYDNTAGNYKYTAPADGFYRFSVQFRLNNIGYDLPANHTSYDIEFTIERFDSGAVFIEARTYTNNGFTGSSLAVDWEPNGFYADVNDYFQVGVVITPNGLGPYQDLDIDADTHFLSLTVETGGGIYQTFDIDDYECQQWQFRTQMGMGDFNTILAAPNESISILIDDGTVVTEYPCFIEEMTYNPETNEAEFTVINSRN